ncbi:MAG TPA: hypothetical protein VK616_09770 [Flavitalea sp.]|nr:hypothetical protein [Flavitalea sp.]
MFVFLILLLVGSGNMNFTKPPTGMSRTTERIQELSASEVEAVEKENWRLTGALLS